MEEEQETIPRNSLNVAEQNETWYSGLIIWLPLDFLLHVAWNPAVLFKAIFTLSYGIPSISFTSDTVRSQESNFFQYLWYQQVHTKIVFVHFVLPFIDRCLKNGTEAPPSTSIKDWPVIHIVFQIFFSQTGFKIPSGNFRKLYNILYCGNLLPRDKLFPIIKCNKHKVDLFQIQE